MPLSLTEIATEIVLRQSRVHCYQPDEMRRALAEIHQTLLDMCAYDIRIPTGSAIEEQDPPKVPEVLVFSPTAPKFTYRDPSKFNVQRFTEYITTEYKWVKERFEEFVEKNVGIHFEITGKLNADRWPMCLDIQYWIPNTDPDSEHVVEHGRTAAPLGIERREAIDNFFRSTSLLRNVEFRGIGNSRYFYRRAVITKRMTLRDYSPFYDK